MKSMIVVLPLIILINVIFSAPTHSNSGNKQAQPNQQSSSNSQPQEPEQPDKNSNGVRIGIPMRGAHDHTGYATGQPLVTGQPPFFNDNHREPSQQSGNSKQSHGSMQSGNQNDRHIDIPMREARDHTGYATGQPKFSGRPMGQNNNQHGGFTDGFQFKNNGQKGAPSHRSA